MLPRRVVTYKSARIHVRGLSQNIAESEFSELERNLFYTCDNIKINLLCLAKVE
jgi:hypothetical protein